MISKIKSSYPEPGKPFRLRDLPKASVHARINFGFMVFFAAGMGLILANPPPDAMVFGFMLVVLPVAIAHSAARTQRELQEVYGA